MTVSSVLVVGGGSLGAAAATALVQRGAEVSLIEPAKLLPLGADAGQTLREAGVEVRVELGLVGAVEVDRHIEAELSSGRVENYDAIVIADAATGERLSRAVSTSRVVTIARIDDLDELSTRLVQR